MDSWLSVHSHAYSKVYLIYGLLFALNIGGLVIFSIYYCKSNYSLEYLIEDDPDIDLSGLKSFSFTNAYDLEYSLGISNLGTTGRLYLHCYTGKCHYEKTYRCKKTRCTGSGDDEKCEEYETTCTDTYSEKDHGCSGQCRRSKSSSCGSSYCYTSRSGYYYDYSTCSSDDNSKNIEYPKSCDAENLVLYWGNLYYRRANNTEYKTLSYLNSAVTANESCPMGRKMCGILDDLGNKLCYPQYLPCPLNHISTNRSGFNYSNYGSANLLKKTVYFTNEEPENGKVIGGLFVDSDLLIKYNDEDCEKLEEGTVMNLLNSHSYRLYRDSLNYDPYTYISGVVQNGKSYLKWCVPGVGKEKNISKIKELKVVFDFNVTNNKNVINPIKTLSTGSYFVCLPGYIGLFFLLIIFIFSFLRQNTIGYYGGFLSCSSSFNFTLFVIFLVSSLLVVIGTILAGVNIGHISTGNKLDLGTNIFDILKKFDIVVICINSGLIILIGIFCLYLKVTPKYLPDQESITQYKTYQDNNKLIECADFKNNNKDDYYNSSDFKNNNNNNNDNNKDPYYKSSDFNNNNNNYYNSSDFNNNTNTNNDNNKDPYYNSSDFKNTNDNNNNYYNSSDFNNNNNTNINTNSNTNTNKDDYYNSSDYNSNLLNNPPQQTNTVL